MAQQIQFSFLCSKSFDKMTPVEGGRMCAACQKKVHDWSHLSEEAAAVQWAAAGGEKVCGRITRETWHSTLSVKKVPRWAKTFLVALLAAFGFLVGTPNTVKGQSVKVEHSSRMNTERPVIKGKLTLEGIGPVPSAHVALVQNGSIVKEVVTNEQGKFQFFMVEPGLYELQINEYHIQIVSHSLEVIAAYSYQIDVFAERHVRKHMGIRDMQ